MDATAGHKLLSFYGRLLKIQSDQDASDEDKMTFITDWGIYCYKVMSFGLKNFGATFQQMVNKIFKELIRHNMKVYVDDMLMKSL